MAYGNYCFDTKGMLSVHPEINHFDCSSPVAERCMYNLRCTRQQWSFLELDDPSSEKAHASGG